MAELLKNIYNKRFFEEFSAALKDVLPSYDEKLFYQMVFDDSWENRELKQRMHHITTNLHHFLGKGFEKDVDVIYNIISALRNRGVKENSLEYFFLPNYIEQYGIDHPEISITSFETITQFCTCEFAVRPFIKKYPEKMLAQMLKWSMHSSHLVRRLSSEGSRPRLPWGMALPELKKDPLPLLPILENLKCDSSETVRRSVANNLNDISKDNPQIVIDLIKKWKGKAKETDWIIKHACRTVLRKADAEALSIFGFSDTTKCLVSPLILSTKRLCIGESLNFSFSIKNLEKKSAKLRVEYGIDYLKANGKPNRKLFKITENVYDPGNEYFFVRNQSFRDLTTRKHYPGPHRIVVVVNGKEYSPADFTIDHK